MKPLGFFVDRPVFASVISILVLIVGGVSYLSLPVAQYPEIAPPTVQISASYPGASAETVAEAVAAPIEQEINGVEGMIYMRSEATGDGRVAITVTFAPGTDIDAAQVLVQNRVAIAEPRLPEDVRRLGVTTRKSSPDLLMIVHLFSPDNSRDQLYISNYARAQVADELARIDGVGEARLFAERAYSMRIWLDPERVAARGLTPGDVIAALRSNNVQLASGTLNQLPVASPLANEISIRTRGRLEAPEEFADIVIRSDDEGRLIRVRDIARVELGALDYAISGYIGTAPALPISISQRPGSNALETASGVIAAMDAMKARFPEGLDYRVVYNPTGYISESIDKVYLTILEAVGLVVLVIVIFLQSVRASIIPILAIPVSLVGSFIILAGLGYSLNTLTLFGMVVVIGIVVDDAIVVVENVERYIAEGATAREAARRTMDEVGGALVAIGLVLSAVFVPAAFLEGVTGTFFRQFAVTIATATLVSVLVSLTLSPALSAVLLGKKAKTDHGIASRLSAPVERAGAAFNAAFDRLSDRYAQLTGRLIARSPIVLAAYGGFILLAGLVFFVTPAGFVPAQDKGYLITVVQLPPGASIARTQAAVIEASERILAHPAVENTAGFAGFDGATFTNAPNSGAIFVTLKPFKDRLKDGMSSARVQAELQAALGVPGEALIFLVAPPPVDGIGTAGGWKLYLQDRNSLGPARLEAELQAFIAALNQRPEVAQVFSVFNTRTPQVIADIDREKAEMLGVPAERINQTLEVYVGSAFVNDFNILGRTYRVTAQADGDWRQDVSDIAKLRTRSDDGAMVPLGSVAQFSDASGPFRVPRFNLFPSAEVQGAAAPGTASGAALDAVQELADNTLSDGFEIAWTDLAYQQRTGSGSGAAAFILSVIFVFLLLAALYESWTLPFAVILIVPMCLLAAMAGINLRGFDNNIMTQIGLIVLIGLASKNAILIVEFARQAEAMGRSRVEAAVEAARLRLRPILMTSFAFILGVLPLVTATGAGAELRQSLGTAVFAGMLGVTFFGLLFTPVFYVACRHIEARFSGVKNKEAAS